MVIFWMLTVCGGVIRQYGNFYQNYNNFSKIVFSVYMGDLTTTPARAALDFSRPPKMRNIIEISKLRKNNEKY